MRMSPYFRKLLAEYESPRFRNSALFERMVNNAKTFADWYEIHRYGDNGCQFEALQNMKKLALNQKRITDIQRNLLELFEILTDSKEQEEILREYLKEHNKKDDLLLVLTVCPIGDLWDDAYFLAMEQYSSPGRVVRGIKARRNKNIELMTP